MDHGQNEVEQLSQKVAFSKEKSKKYKSQILYLQDVRFLSFYTEPLPLRSHLYYSLQELSTLQESVDNENIEANSLNYRAASIEAQLVRV